MTALIAEALDNNPEIHASQARWALFESRIAQAGALDDPMLMLRIDNGLLRDPLDFQRDGTTAKVIGISQALPFFGKRELRRQSAELDVKSSHLETEERKLSLRRMVSETWYRLYLVDRELELVEASIATLDDLNRFAETLYSVGQGGQQDLLNGQVRRSKMEDARLALHQQRRSLSAMLNILLYREPDAELPPVTEVTLQPAALGLTELESLAEQHQPQLQGLALQEQKSEVGRKLAEKEFYPDVTVALEYMQRDRSEMDKDGYDMYSAGLTFNLPVFRERRRAMLAEAEAEGRMARQERAMIQNRIRLTLTDALARLDRLKKTAELYRDGLIPQAEQAFEASLAAYRAGRAEYMTVLDSQMSLFDYSRDYFEAISEHQRQRALVEEAVGTVLPDVTTDKEQP
ncbi:MAG: TolC family protein [Trichloromonas sp.]|nr:TolC family protein [Trichloromonas sp.]